MKKGISLALVIVGLIFIFWGINASESISSEFSRIFTGSPTERTMWLMAIGIVCSVAGLFGLMGRSKGV